MPTAAQPRETAANQAPASLIDVLVFKRLKALGIPPAKRCTDEVFVRRAFLDVIGTLPTAQEVRGFLSDQTANKRGLLIDRLLARPEYADYWAMRFSDILRVKSEFPVNLWPLAAQAYHHWIRTILKENWPYDRFGRALLTTSGSNFRQPAVNFYRAVPAKTPEAIAKTVALTLMGQRAEKWPKQRLAALSVFFSQVAYKTTGEWKEEIVFNDLSKASVRQAKGVLPDGKTVPLPLVCDPRGSFADWLLGPANPWFAGSIVNRQWSWLLGRGIVHEVDDFRPDNPPSNPELLEALAKLLADNKYDLKGVFRAILNSATYQLSAIPASAHNDSANAFAHYRLRRLEAEVLIDAINQISGSTDGYSSMAPEPFTFIPERQRSIALADGSITSPFLEMFGRPSRDTGLDSERTSQPTAAQRLHMLNSSHIQRKIERGPKLVALYQAAKSPSDLVEELYLTILSRFPSPEERKAALDYAAGLPAAQQGAIDVAWALLNSTEFSYRH